MIFVFEFRPNAGNLQFVEDSQNLIDPGVGQLFGRLVQSFKHPGIGRRGSTEVQDIALLLHHRHRLPKRRALFFDGVVVDIDFGQLVSLKPQKIGIDPIGELSRQINFKFDFVRLILVRTTHIIIFFIALLSKWRFSA